MEWYCERETSEIKKKKVPFFGLHFSWKRVKEANSGVKYSSFDSLWLGYVVIWLIEKIS